LVLGLLGEQQGQSGAKVSRGLQLDVQLVLEGRERQQLLTGDWGQQLGLLGEQEEGGGLELGQGLAEAVAVGRGEAVEETLYELEDVEAVEAELLRAEAVEGLFGGLVVGGCEEL